MKKTYVDVTLDEIVRVISTLQEAEVAAFTQYFFDLTATLDKVAGFATIDPDAAFAISEADAKLYGIEGEKITIKDGKKKRKQVKTTSLEFITRLLEARDASLTRIGSIVSNCTELFVTIDQARDKGKQFIRYEPEEAKQFGFVGKEVVVDESPEK